MKITVVVIDLIVETLELPFDCDEKRTNNIAELTILRNQYN